MKVERKIHCLLLTTYCLLLTILAACGSASDDAAVQTVEQYLTAKVTGDTQTVTALLCSALEVNLMREANAFTSVTDARIEGMDCRKDANSSSVTCAGKIVALYGTEQTEFQLSSYAVVQEDGEWKWCGETQ
jgi:hypothetical protein